MPAHHSVGISAHEMTTSDSILVSSSETFLRRGIGTLGGVNSAKSWVSGFSFILKLSWIVPGPMKRPGNCLGTGVFSRVSTWVSRCNVWMAGRFC